MKIYSSRRKREIAKENLPYELKVQACQLKGMAYFKEIGSYPYLSDGRDAAKVAKERCNRSLVAFGS